MAGVTGRYPVEGVHAKLVVVAGAILWVDVRSVQQTINSSLMQDWKGSMYKKKKR